MKKATRRHTRDHNCRLVLRTVYPGGEISRADIARLTGLTRPTVSAIVGDLLDSDLIIEAGKGPSAGGKRPTLLTVNSDGRHLIALDLSGDEFHALLLNLKGEMASSASLPALAGTKPSMWQRFSEAVAARDPMAIEFAVNAGKFLGAATANLVGVFNINTIVLAGRLADSLLAASMMPIDKVVIIPTHYNAGVMGEVYLAPIPIAGGPAGGK